MKDELIKILQTQDLLDDKTYEQQADEILNLFNVRKCACPPLVACEICGEEKNLDGDFWKNKKKHDC